MEIPGNAGQQGGCGKSFLKKKGDRPDYEGVGIGEAGMKEVEIGAGESKCPAFKLDSIEKCSYKSGGRAFEKCSGKDKNTRKSKKRLMMAWIIANVSKSKCL